MTDPTPTKRQATRRWPFLSLAAAAFAVLVTLGPVLATSRIDAGGSENLYAAGEAGMLVAREAAAQDSMRAIATSAELVPQLPPETTTTTEVPAAQADPPGESPVPPVAVSIPAPDPPVDSGGIELTLDQSTLEQGLHDGATVEWEFTLSNTGDEYLWGVYAFLEGHGTLVCDQRQLAVGASTACRAEETVWVGDQTASAWATAWTANRMVEASASTDFIVEG